MNLLFFVQLQSEMFIEVKTKFLFKHGIETTFCTFNQMSTFPTNNPNGIII